MQINMNDHKIPVAELISQRDELKKDLSVARYWANHEGYNDFRSEKISEITIALSEVEFLIQKHAMVAASNGRIIMR
jgi:hypothetical protein